MIGESGLSRAGTASISERAIESMGLRDGTLTNTMLRTDIAQMEIDDACFDLTVQRAREEVKAGASLGAQSSMFKYYGTELNMRRYELLMAIQGLGALDWNGGEGREGLLPKTWLRTKGNSIEGGTSEIQLNIIAKRILGLPG
jgi:acyl-CoA dehydrogenase